MKLLIFSSPFQCYILILFVFKTTFSLKFMENDQKRKLKRPKFGKINSKLLGTLCWSINKLKSIVDENKKEGKNNFIFKF